MKTRALALAVAVAATLSGFVVVAHAEGDIYSRLMTMRELDRAQSGMITKEAFLAMVSKLWDMKAEEMKAKNGMLTPQQLQELQKVLGRTVQ